MPSPARLPRCTESYFTVSRFRREVDLNGKNIGRWTPLMYASYIGHDNIVNLLLEAGVNVNATTAKGLTPLMLAASCGNESIAYFLLQVQNGPTQHLLHISNFRVLKVVLSPSILPKSKALSWSRRTVEAGRPCFTAPAQATSRWSSSCWITTQMPTSSEGLHSSPTPTSSMSSFYEPFSRQQGARFWFYSADGSFCLRT